MIVINSSAEMKLIEEIKSSPESFRCLYIPFSKVTGDHDNIILQFSNHVENEFESRNTKIFVGSNNDVFLLTREIYRKEIATFLSTLNHKLMPDSPPSSLAILFEKDINDKELYSLCRQRIERLHKERLDQRRQQLKQEELERQKQVLNTEINKNHVSKIPAKRLSRKDVQILVIEDDLLTQRLIKNTLGDRYALSTAKDGYEALTVYADTAPDVVFLDIGLPDANGKDILRKIIAMDSDAYIVMLSGNGDRENILEAMTSGAKGFIGKPFTQNKLFQYIEKSPHYTEKKLKGEVV